MFVTSAAVKDARCAKPLLPLAFSGLRPVCFPLRATAATDVLPVEQARHHLTLLHPTPELAGSHSSQASPFMNLEVHGCYRITGPAVLTHTEVPNAMVASLGEGSTIEFFDPDGNILIPQESLEDPHCLCMGHLVEIQGTVDIDASLVTHPDSLQHLYPPCWSSLAGAHLPHTYNRDGKVVMSSDSLTQGTSIRMAPGAVLLHPVTVIRRSDAGT